MAATARGRAGEKIWELSPSRGEYIFARCRTTTKPYGHNRGEREGKVARHSRVHSTAGWLVVEEKGVGGSCPAVLIARGNAPARSSKSRGMAARTSR